jgi:hypothetical protein
MPSFLFDRNTNDLDLTNGIRLTTEPSDELASRLQIRLQWLQGEWFLDERLGIPYFQRILVKGTSLQTVRSIYREAIRETPGVDEILNLDLDLNKAARELRVDFKVRSVDGEVVADSVEFVIGG